jgi:hypothetical protein
MDFHTFKSVLAGMSRKEVLALADAADVPRSTIEKIRYGWIASPGVVTFEKLVSALKTNVA